MRYRVVDAQSESFDVAGWTIGLELLDIAAPIPDLSCDGSAIKLDPGLRPR